MSRGSSGNRRPRPARESTLVAEIVRALRALPGVVVRKRHGSGWGVSGDPDLYGSAGGRHFEIEVKRPGEHPTPLQRARLDQWRASGALSGVARSAAYSLEAFRRIRARREQQQPQADSEPRTIPWREWFATAGIEVDPAAAKVTAPQDDSAGVYTAFCRDAAVWLVRQGSRWVMFAGSRRPECRRDFASPFLEHAKRTAAAWYGPAPDGWRAEGPPRRVRRSTEVVEADPDGI
jgi:hypothetical protein